MAAMKGSSMNAQDKRLAIVTIAWVVLTAIAIELAGLAEVLLLAGLFIAGVFWALR
jgi:hypothetical protein